jgi:two-component system sensor histidine kinase RegB
LDRVLRALSVACYGALFLLPDDSQHAHHAHADHMRSHLEGMWVALALTAVFTVYFVNRVTRALAVREAELEEEKERTNRAERLASLATLAAGAAHELSTPLSTIAVAANELVRRVGAEGAAAQDVELIRSEVRRCREILQQMAVELGEHESGGKAMSASAVAELALDGFEERERVALRVGEAAGECIVPSAPRAVATVIRALLKNASHASDAKAPIELGMRVVGNDLELAVRDRGHGMTPDVARRATEPFFTTKEPGAGMGLGLFLAHETARRLGGALEIATGGGGTTARLVLPLGPKKSGAPA